MNRFILLLCLLVMSTFACTVSTSAADASGVKFTPRSTATMPVKSTQQPQNRVICRSGGLNVRSGAGTAFSSVSVLADGSRVVLTGLQQVAKDGGVWKQIATPAGWVNSDYLCEAK